MKTNLIFISAALALLAGLHQAAGQGTAFTYQGRLEHDGNVALDGLYDFELRLFPLGPAQVGIQQGPTLNPTAVPVTNGLFTLRLDFGSGIFSGARRWLEVAVRTNGVTPYATLLPRVELTPTPYAIFAGGAAASGITGTLPAGAIADGSITALKLGSDVGIWSRSGANTYYGAGNVGVGRIPQVPLHVEGTIRSSGSNGGIVQAYNPSNGTALVELSWLNDQARIRVGGNGAGSANGFDIQGTSDKSLMRVTQSGDATILESLTIGTNVFLENFEAGGGARMILRNATGGATFHVDAEEGDGGGAMSLLNSNGVRTVYLDANQVGGGYLRLRDAANEQRATITATALGVTQSLYNSNSVVVLSLDTSTDGAGRIAVRNQAGSDRVIVDGADTSRGGRIDLRDTSGTTTVQILGAETTNFGSRLQMFRANGLKTVELKSEEGTNNGSQLVLANSRGTNTIVMDAQEGTDINAVGDITMFRRNGTNIAIQIDADYGNSGVSRIITDVLEITGGSDLSENFDINSIPGAAQPGMLLAIDPSAPGHLRLSAQAYDRTIAGVLSGAGGVKPGMLMGQHGTVASGKQPVALTGRVFCWVDADAGGAIQPGDLITSSDTPGHGMKVMDHARAHGATIGKAMTPLAQGRGLVLILVSLQ